MNAFLKLSSLGKLNWFVASDLSCWPVERSVQICEARSAFVITWPPRWILTARRPTANDPQPRKWVWLPSKRDPKATPKHPQMCEPICCLSPPPAPSLRCHGRPGARHPRVRSRPRVRSGSWAGPAEQGAPGVAALHAASGQSAECHVPHGTRPDVWICCSPAAPETYPFYLDEKPSSNNKKSRPPVCLSTEKT